MATDLIAITPAEVERLRSLSQQTGREQEELIREALDLLDEKLKRESRLERLRGARGIWQDRSDLPTLDELRADWDRGEPRGE